MKTTYPIPEKTNHAILLFSSIACIFLLWLGSHVYTWYAILTTAIVFAFVEVNIYSILHEAEHDVYHKKASVNYWAGVWLAALFGGSFTFLRECHIGHHKRNRSDYEMFDLYYPHQNKYIKSLYLYLLLIGFYYLLIPLAVIVFAIYPGIMQSKILRKDVSAAGMLSGISKNSFRKIQLESIFVVLLHLGLFYLLNLQWQVWLIMLGVHAFIWSSTDYVNHAFSPRDVINGAHNHKMNIFFEWIFLNKNFHLSHHRYPQIPWIHLKNFMHKDEHRGSYLIAYFKLWGGPKLTTEPPPKPLSEYAKRN